MEELGQTRNLSDTFSSRRTVIHKANAKDVERIMNKFKMLSITLASSAPPPSTGISFWRKNEPKEVVNLLDDDSVNPDDVLNCPLCRDEFKRLSTKKKSKCLNCGKIVCSACNANPMPVKGMQDGVEREVKVCNGCHQVITREHKRLQLKHYFASSLKSSFTTFYEEVYLLVGKVQRDMPKFRVLLGSPLTVSSFKKAKDLDTSLGKTMLDFEREIKNLEHFKVTTKKQQQLRDAIKMSFVQALAGVGPEYKLLHKQLEVAATQPLAPDDPAAASSPAVPKLLRASSSSVATSQSISPASAPSSPATANRKDNIKRQTLGSRLSSFTSLFSSEAAIANNETGPYISGVNPVLSPLSGNERITILGDRFDDGCGVEIAGIDCPIIERTNDSIVVLSPPQSVSAPTDVCVYNSNGERCVMSQMLFYAEDNMFTKNSSSDDDISSTDNSYSITDSIKNTTKPVSRTPSRLDLNSSGSGMRFGSHNTSFTTTTNGNDNHTTNTHNTSNTNNNNTHNTNTHNTHNTHTNLEDNTNEANGNSLPMSVDMINPVVSPLQGTRITMELSKPLPPGTTIKVGGKLVHAHAVDGSHKQIYFISPPLSVGMKNIEITPANGKSILLDSILLYEPISPQTPQHYPAKSESFTTSSSPPFVASSPPFVASSPPFVASSPPFVASSPPYMGSSPPFVASPETNTAKSTGRVWGKRG